MSETESIVDAFSRIVALLVRGHAPFNLITIQDGTSVTISVSTTPRGMGVLIGKQGRTSRSLRIILNAVAMQSGRKYSLDITEMSADALSSTSAGGRQEPNELRTADSPTRLPALHSQNGPIVVPDAYCTLIIQNVPCGSEQDLVSFLKGRAGVVDAATLVESLQASAISPEALLRMTEVAIASGVSTVVASVLKGAADGLKAATEDWVKRILKDEQRKNVDCAILYGPDDKPITTAKHH